VKFTPPVIVKDEVEKNEEVKPAHPVIKKDKTTKRKKR